MNNFFQNLAQETSQITGSTGAFITGFIITLIWLILGPTFHFSDTWQLVISTISSAVTFLMVFLIQYSQNKDTKALQLKLDELIRIHKNARNELVKIEQKPEEKLDKEIEKIEKITGEKEEGDIR